MLGDLSSIFQYLSSSDVSQYWREPQKMHHTRRSVREITSYSGRNHTLDQLTKKYL
ncbi:unnamed protein product [Arabidopsis halleri]